MKRIVFVGLVLAAMVFGTMALAFDAYFSDAAGNKLGTVWEGQQVYIAVKDPEKGACGIAEFPADLVIFDFKTGAYINVANVVFRELGGIGSGLYFWVAGKGSNTKVSVQVGKRSEYTSIEGQTHVLGTISPSAITNWTDGSVTASWAEGAWEYVDENVLDSGVAVGTDRTPGTTVPVNTSVRNLPKQKLSARVDFEGLSFAGNAKPSSIAGRFENNDTLVLIVADRTDERNIDQDQAKIVDTVAKFSVTPTKLQYGCGPACQNIVVTIEDPDENLNPNEIEYVPFFVIINPGSWNPQTYGANNFCSLMMRGGFSANNDVVGTGTPDSGEPIRWYNIYSTDRYMDYEPGNNPWWNETAWGNGLVNVVFFAAETSVDSGVFTFDFGNLEDFQKALWTDPQTGQLFTGVPTGFDPRAVRFPPGTTIAFYYIDPNDFDDMDLATAVIGDRPHSQTFLTDANGVPVSEVKIGHGGLYVRVYDADANVEACCQDKVVVHICDPHNEDDSEYVVIDEISNNSGIFFTQSGIRLEPVWDAVNGYQLVFDDWKVQAFNEDTIFVRYNSVDYESADLNKLGDGNPNDNAFPPKIATAARNQEWDVSFAKVKVYDFQVFDGTTHHMRFLDGEYNPVTEIPVSGSLYLEVTDLDQNEEPLLRELIFGGWNKDAFVESGTDRTDTSALGSSNGEPTDLGDSAPDQDAYEDSAPIWWMGGESGTASDSGNSDVMTPQGAVSNPDPVFLGATDGDDDGDVDESISGIAETVKIFMWNAQRGTWERIDLRETAVGSGVFRSTVCVLVSDTRHPGDGNLGSKAGDTIMAFYQDPSNHSDIAIISIKVSEGGAGAVTPPTVQLSVVFDKTTYYPGDTVTITVTDANLLGAGLVTGTKLLVLKDKDGAELQAWNELTFDAQGKATVTYTLPETVKLGTITAVYTSPVTGTPVSATANVVAKALSNVTGITISPNPFKTSTTFTIQAEPAGAVAEKITITIYDLTGAKVAVISGENTASVTWNGGNLRNGAYIYVAVVESGTKAWTFKGFVYIER